MTNSSNKSKGKLKAIFVLPVMFALVLTLGAVSVPAGAVVTITGDYVASSGLYIKTKGRLNATNLGIGYPGQGAKADCYAMNGDWVSRTYSNGVVSASIWASAKDLDTNVKGYSSVVWTTFPDLISSFPPSGFVMKSGDTCWFPGKVGLY
jgi:hypothetical protein